MPVEGLDHINIDTCKPEETIEFYTRVLGLENRPQDRPGDPTTGAWLFSGAQAVVHLGFVDNDHHDPDREYPTGSFNHFAFSCTDFEGTRAALDKLGVEYRASQRPERDFSQLFVQDPNGVNLELNIPNA